MVGHVIADQLVGTGDIVKSTLRTNLVARNEYVILPAEDPTALDLTSLDVNYLKWNGSGFFYDPLDTTSTHDGVSR
jgi:hypothetical protein